MERIKDYFKKYKQRYEMNKETLNDVVPSFTWLFIKSWVYWQIIKVKLLWDDEDV